MSLAAEGRVALRSLVARPISSLVIVAQSADLFIPLASVGDRLDPHARRTTLIGRRRSPGVGIAAVAGELSRLAEDLERRQPASGLPRRLSVVPALLAHPIDSRGLAAPLRLFGAGAALLLLLAGANVSNLLLGQSLTRGREAGIRKALRGGAWDLVRRPLLEALPLAAGGAALGLLLAFWARRLLELYLGPELTGVLRFEPRLLLLALAAALVAVLVVGLPAWVARRTPALALLRGTATGSGAAPTRVLAAMQVGLCVVLLSASGLLGVTLHNLMGRGASRREIVRWVVGRGVRLALLGAAGGGLASLAASRQLEPPLYGIDPAQVFAVGAAMLLLVVGASALSAYLPSRRAAALDPSTLLRSEA